MLAWAGGGAFAQVVEVPDAHLNHAEGTVAYAPAGAEEWHDIQPRRVLRRGDRLWTDRGSRAELQAGGHAVRVDGQSQLVLENVSPTATQLSLTQGSIVATVAALHPGDSFEVGTPNLAFRAREAGDYRIDADVKRGITRIVVLSGSGVVYGEKGEALELRTRQRAVFRDRDLTRMPQAAFAATDGFDRWAAARRRGEPTVTMPALASAPASAPVAAAYTGPEIVIPGDGPAPAGRSRAKTAPVKTAPVIAAGPDAAKALPPAAPLKVSAPVLPPATSVRAAVLPPPAAAPAPAATEAHAAAKAQAEAEARTQARAAARAQEQRRLAQQRVEQQRHAAARAQQQKEAAARAAQEKHAVQARRAEEQRRAAAARRAEAERQRAQARRAHEWKQEQKRLALRRAEEQRRQAVARRAAEEKERKLAAARQAAEDRRLAQARREQIAHLQAQAARAEQAVRQHRADQERREEQARREEEAQREEEAHREALARREEAERRQRALAAEQARREQARRNEEVWLRQQQPLQPLRPAPMGVPFVRRVS